MKQVYIETMGCQMNKSDTERMLGMLAHFNYVETKEPHEADLLMINTCSIRQLSEDKAFSAIGLWGKWKKHRPDLKIGFVFAAALPSKKQKVFLNAVLMLILYSAHILFTDFRIL